MPPRRLIGLVALVGIAFATAALFLPHSAGELRELLSIGTAGPIIAAVAWIVLTPALFPGTIMAAAAGLAFGAVWGIALSLGGAVLGGIVAFVIARTVARDWVANAAARRPRLTRLSALLERRGFAAVLAARLAPGVPATWLHYVAGISPITLRAFAAAIALGALLRTAPYAFVGDGIASGAGLGLIIAAASIVFGGAAAALLVRAMRRGAVPA